ncbi:MAG: hypothetical protein Q9216_003068 [Gyalolechia sp. 2 TL-2023]
MDPLSVTASTLTILGALDTAFQLIRQYRDAPNQLEALNNEIVDITAAVTEASRVITESQSQGFLASEKVSHLNLALSKIQDKARKLEALLRRCIPTASSKGGRTSRISWLKVKAKVQNLQQELRAGRFDLLVALAAFSASSSLRIEMSVQDLFRVTNETKSRQQGLEDRITVEHERDRLAQDQLSAQFLAQLQNLQLHRSSVVHQQTEGQTRSEVPESTPQDRLTNEQPGSVTQAQQSPHQPGSEPLAYQSDSLVYALAIFAVGFTPRVYLKGSWEVYFLGILACQYCLKDVTKALVA